MWGFVRRLSLRVQLTVTIAAGMTATAAFVLYYFPSHQRATATLGLEIKVDAVLRLAGHAARVGVEFEDPGSVQTALAALREDDDFRAARVYKVDGTTFAQLAAPGFESLKFWDTPPREGMLEYRGDQVLAARPLLATDHRTLGTIVAAFSMDRINRDVQSSVTATVLVSLTIVLAGLLIGLAVARLAVNPLASTVNVLEAMARGDLTVRLTVTAQNEIFRMAQALNSAIDSMRTTLNSIASHVSQLTAASNALGSLSDAMTESAQQTNTQASSASSAVGDVNDNIRTIAANTEQLSLSVHEISTNVHQAAVMASSATTLASEANSTILRLGDSSREIGKVINVITGIAAQTNLLALNATIEAARAGDSGRGFVVVANEVKDLAKETAKATADIGQRIDAIQQDTAAAISVIEKVASTIGQISSFQTAVASAVEQQASTTAQISRYLQDVAHGSEAIVSTMQQMLEAAADTSQGSSAARQSASELSQMAQTLEQILGRFTFDKRNDRDA